MLSYIITGIVILLCFRYLRHNKGAKQKLKLALAYPYVWILKKTTPPAINYNHRSSDIARNGISSPPEAWIKENPRPLLPNIHAADSLGFCGVHKNGSVLVTRITRRPNRVAETWVFLRLPSGEEYQLPNHPDTKIFNTKENSFSAGGLTFELLEPLRCWRVSFNGYLRKGIRNDWKNDDEDTVLVRFNFLWHPIYSYVALPHDFKNFFLADLLAKQKWSKGFVSPYKLFSEEVIEQIGQLHGEVTIENEQKQQLLFRGLRKRTYGVRNWEAPANRLSISGMLKNGRSFHIFGEQKNGEHLKRYLYGYILSPCNMVIHHIDNISLNTNLLLNFPKFPERLGITLTANKKEYALEVYPNVEGFKVYEGSDWNTEIEVLPVNVILNGMEGQGLVEYAHQYHGLSPIPARSSLSLLKEPDVKQCNSYVVRFDDMECRSSSVVGGKGASLANMAHLPFKFGNFTIPDGICLTKTAFEHYLKQNFKVKAALLQLQKVAWKRITGTLSDECENVVKLIYETEVPKGIKNELKSKLVDVFGEDFGALKFAVRSSAIGEDGEEMSAAGQNETFLGVKGFDEILAAIIKCWASQFAFRSIEYKRQNGQLLNAGMGVVIQKMVPAEVAGVLFTRDPLTGSMGRMTISANYGLGESVVSAMADPDAITLKRTWNDQLSILQKDIGAKKVMIAMSDDSGTIEKEVDQDKASECALSNEMAIKLGQIAIFLEQCFGTARDIEWALSQKEIFLLQSRPLTAENIMTDFEIIHELDSATRTDEEHYSTANVAEVLPGAGSPVVLTGGMRAMSVFMQEQFTWKLQSHRFDPTVFDGFATFYGHYFFDKIQQKVWSLSKKKNPMNRAMELGMHGRVLDDDHVLEKALDRFENPPLRVSLLLLSVVAIGMLFGGRKLKKGIKNYQHYPVPTKGANTIEDAFNRIGKAMFLVPKVMDPHMSVSSASTVWNVIVLNVLSHGSENYQIEHYTDFAKLIGSANGAESGDVPFSLKELAETISKEMDPENFLSLTPEDGLKWLQENSGESSKKFKNFLERHGHRGIKEFDMMAVTWGIKPVEVIKVLQDMLKVNSSMKEYSREKRAEDVLDTLSTPLTPFRRMLLSQVMKGCRKGVLQRERAKSLLVKYYDCLRHGYRHLADMMVAEGMLPDPNIIFFFTHEEIGFFIKTRSANLLRRAKQRLRMHDQKDKLQFPELIDGFPVPVQEDSNISYDTINQITGFPVSQGIVQGPARVVVSFHEVSTIQPGEILITHATDIGWSPYFPMLSGVVTELGGLISHGAVVAREFGIPCIVGAQGATKMFRSGDTVLLDATKGVLSKIQ